MDKTKILKWRMYLKYFFESMKITRVMQSQPVLSILDPLSISLCLLDHRNRQLILSHWFSNVSGHLTLPEGHGSAHGIDIADKFDSEVDASGARTSL